MSVLLCAAHTTHALATTLAPPPTTTWRTVPIRKPSQALDENALLSEGEAIRQGEALVLIENVCSTVECAQLVEAAQRAADADSLIRSASNLPQQKLSRLPVALAKQRAEAWGTPCAEALDDGASALCEAILLRVMALIDEGMPSITASLFNVTSENAAPHGSLVELRVGEELEFSSREPYARLTAPSPSPIAHSIPPSLCSERRTFDQRLSHHLLPHTGQSTSTAPAASSYRTWTIRR